MKRQRMGWMIAVLLMTGQWAMADLVDFTSASQLVDPISLEPNGSPHSLSVANNLDFTINGIAPTELYSLGFVKNGNYIGYCNMYIGTPSQMGGQYRFDPNTIDSAATDYLAIGETPWSAVLFYDLNGNGKFGELDITATTITVYTEPGEMIADPNAFTIDGDVAGFANLPYATNSWGNVSGAIPAMDVTVTPEPASMTLLAIGAAGLLRRRKTTKPFKQ